MLDKYQIEQLDRLLEYYFKGNSGDNFKNIHSYSKEGYKWKAVQVFHESGVTSSLDKNFFVELERALTEDGDNLLHHRNRDTLYRLIHSYEKEMRTLFYNLEGGSNENLEDRLTAFIRGADRLRKRDPSRNWQKLLACDAMSCLAFLKPDEYYFYRPFVIIKAFTFLNGTEYTYRSPVSAATNFQQLCNDIREYLTREKPEYVEKYHVLLQEKKEDYYQDPNNHLLVQNILFSLQYAGLELEDPIPG